jgi:hypothetical protein
MKRGTALNSTGNANSKQQLPNEDLNPFYLNFSQEHS